MGSPTSPLRLGIRSQAPGARIYLYTALHPYPGTTNGRAGLPFCVPPSRARTPSAPPRSDTTRSTKPHAARTMAAAPTMPGGSAPAGTGISTRYPSTTPVGLALGSDSPRADQPSPGTLGHTAEEILTPQTLLMPAFSLPAPPHPVTRDASPSPERSPTQRTTRLVVAASAVCLQAPLNFRRKVA